MFGPYEEMDREAEHQEGEEENEPFQADQICQGKET
jgi:hypothetical protein